MAGQLSAVSIEESSFQSCTLHVKTGTRRMIIIFSYTQVVVYHELVPQGETVRALL